MGNPVWLSDFGANKLKQDLLPGLMPLIALAFHRHSSGNHGQDQILYHYLPIHLRLGRVIAVQTFPAALPCMVCLLLLQHPELLDSGC